MSLNVRRMSAVPLPLAWPMEPSTDASEHTPVVTASAVTVCSKEGTRRRLGGAHDSLRKWLDTLREQWPPSFPNTSGGRSRQNTGAGMFGRYARLCPLRRSLPSQRIAPGQTRHTHAECVKRTNASQPRRRGRTHFAALHTHDLAAESRPHTCRIPTAIRWQTRRVTNRQSDDPGPCHSCAAILSIAADAPTYTTLGSHVKSGLRMRRSPRRAVQVSSKWRFAVGHGRHQPHCLAQR